MRRYIYCIAFWLGTGAWIYALIDAVIHYHIDWAKMNAGKHYNLKADNSEWFWILLGFDQFLHHLTLLCFSGRCIQIFSQFIKKLCLKTAY